MTRLLSIIAYLLLTACSSSEPEKGSTLIKSLLNTSWESQTCEIHRRYGYSTHYFTIESSKLVYYYQDYGVDCIELRGEHIEERYFSVGEELVTENGLVATKMIINKIVIHPDGVYPYKDLLYNSNNSLYFGKAVTEEECEPGNALVDIDYRDPILDLFYCDQQPTKLDFEKYYTKKI